MNKQQKQIRLLERLNTINHSIISIQNILLKENNEENNNSIEHLKQEALQTIETLKELFGNWKFSTGSPSGANGMTRVYRWYLSKYNNHMGIPTRTWNSDIRNDYAGKEGDEIEATVTLYVLDRKDPKEIFFIHSMTIEIFSKKDRKEVNAKINGGLKTIYSNDENGILSIHPDVFKNHSQMIEMIIEAASRLSSNENDLRKVFEFVKSLSGSESFHSKSPAEIARQKLSPKAFNTPVEHNPNRPKY